MKIKNLILPICIALVVLLSIGGVVAYIAVKTNPIVNTFDAGQIQTTVYAADDGVFKCVASIKVEDEAIASDTEAYLRFKVVATWVSTDVETNLYAGTPVLGTDYSLAIDEEEVIQIGGFYYVKSSVSPNQEIQLATATLLDGANIPDGYQLKIEILTDAIQSRPVEAVSEAWGIVPDGDGNITG